MGTAYEASRREPTLPGVVPGEGNGAAAGAPGALPEVLVIEDDESLLPVLEFLIEEARPGCRVAWARTSAEGEAWLKKAPERSSIRVVIADLFIQGDKNGVELWRRYAAADRSFLVISGAARSRFLALVRGGEAPLFLAKPLDLGECVETLKLILANPGWY
jgi:DNA-binding NtrC family response regulator